MKRYAVDIETDGLDPRKNKIVAVGIYDGTTTEVLQAHKTDIGKYLRGLDGELVFHNAKFDLSFIYNQYDFIPKFYCTYMASKVLMNGLDFSNSLVNCLDYFLGVKETVHEDKKALQTSFRYGVELSEKQIEYVKSDIIHLLPLADKLRTKITEDSLDEVINLEFDLLPVILKMERFGVRIDTVKLNQLIEQWQAKSKVLVGELDNIVVDLHYKKAKPIMFCTTNFASTQQVSALFKDLGEEVPLSSEGKPSSDYDSLQTYLNERPNSIMAPFIEKLMEYREYNKLITTYGKTLLSKVEDGHIRGTFNQLGTDTGRLSSSNPNMQNFPKEGDGGRLRECFIPDVGCKMVTCDMQAAEVRLAADFSKDKILMGNILHKEDMHSKLASISYSIIFGEPFTVSSSKEPVMVKGIQVIPNNLRDAHKSATFCKFYKGGPARIYGVLGKYINLFHKKNATNVARNISLALDRELIGLSKYLDGVIAEANKTRKLRTKLGRVRYFKENAYGDAANLPIQGANGDAIKIAMVQVDKYLTENGYGRLLMSVHDELVCSIKEEYAEECAVKIKEIMSESLGKFLETLSGDASVTVGDYWSK